ncbi:Pectinesterase 2 [Acorus gramineus]|uniref:Pectinesterase 2 n=1 Tax=Acorus gramineus TaxID=55184 RepID=A0AAV9BTB3_ACOGR|nr:Pectinesterase 2 [Acorus gramineus]
MSVKANVIVSEDGSGNFMTITEAVKDAPFSTQRYVIYIKKGTYTEDIVTVRQPNITFIGDGMGKTVMQTSRSIPDVQHLSQSPNLGN